jgi:CelD/BcsL family acetyltransferase involved in cellulose biosynthesis
MIEDEHDGHPSLKAGMASETGSVAHHSTMKPLIVREYLARSLPTGFLDRWQSLEDRSLEGNAFLSPHFVLPALEHLPESAAANPIILAVESPDNERLLGLGVFETCRGSRLLPLRHLRSWRSTHSFFDSLLVDRGRAMEVATTLFRWLQRQGDRWHGISFRDRSADSELSAVLDEAAAQCGISWQEDWSSERASIPTRQVPDDCLNELYSGRRRREFTRRLRRLESHGDVHFELKQCETGHQNSLETFLDLEARGWKGEMKTAMGSDPGHASFVREMAARFSTTGGVVFGELSAGGRTVASALSLLSGETLFAFKIGWDPGFARCSPGILCDLQLMQSVGTLDGVELIDSCAEPDSWLEDVWPWRRALTTGVFPTTSVGRFAAATTVRMKRLKRWFRSST